MKLPCEMVRDLLPMYEEGMCSPASRAAVEEHLRDCVACQAQLQGIRSLPQPEISVEEKAADAVVVKTFRKVRRRWGISLLAVLVAVPMLLLSVNQARGRGLCFTNPDEIVQALQWVQLLEDGAFAAAAAKMDYAELYDEIQQVLVMEPEDYLGEYVAVEMEGETWMARQEFYQQCLQGKEQDALQLWEDLLLNDSVVLVPARLWQQVVERHQDLLIELESGELMLRDREWALQETQWGHFMVDVNSAAVQADTGEELYGALDFMPETLWQEQQPRLQAEAQQWYRENQQYYGTAADMTVEEFAALVGAYYAEQLQLQADAGVEFHVMGYESCYRTTQTPGWLVQCGVQVMLGEKREHLSLDLQVQDGKLQLVGTSRSSDVHWLADVTEALHLKYPH